TKMITDSQLYSLAIFLGSAAMMLIVLYHFLEVNSEDHKVQEKPNSAAGKSKAKA
ncbi:traub transcription factor family protein, partial [Pyrenophora tritici-repentis]